MYSAFIVTRMRDRIPGLRHRLQRRPRHRVASSGGGRICVFTATTECANRRAHPRRRHRAAQQGQADARASAGGAASSKLIALAGTGTDNVDLAAAQERGIAVCNVRGYCTASVVQHAWAMILSLTQHLPQYARLATDGSWVESEESTVLAHPIRELPAARSASWDGASWAAASPRSAEAFGMRVIIANRPGGAARAGTGGPGRAARNGRRRVLALPA